jgi:HEAT repeat protein/beta-lactamase regulating signal transducer with metallopeptidase domain
MTRISEFVLNFLLNATWQIVAITIVASLGARLLKHAPARYRHALWVAALVLSLGLPVWTVLGVAQKAVSTVTAPVAFTTAHETASGPSFAGTVEPATSGREDGSLSVGNLLARRRHEVETTPGLLFGLAIGYALFLLYRLIRLARLWRQEETLRGSVYERELSPRMERIVELCRAVFRLGRVPLGCSTTALLPVTVGARNPLIVLPESLYAEAREDTLLSILGHEMAHVARRDFALNLLCEFVRLPLSFHPLTNFIKRQIDRARELACDELVTERLLAPEAYARSLMRVANASIQPMTQAFMLSIFDADILEERIMKLTQERRQLGLRVGRAIFVTTFSVLCLSALTISTFSFDLRTNTIPLGADPVAIQSAASQSPATELTQEPNATQTRSDKLLNSPSPQERAQAACDVGRRHAVEAIPMLVSMLGDDSRTEPLRCWDSGRWNPALETFKQPSPGEEAAIALASMGKPAFEPLTNELTNANASVRRNAAWAIGELTNMLPDERAGAVPQLVSLLNDSDEWVRMAAARALGELRDERAGERLIAALSDSQWRVRELAAWALSEMKEERAVKALCNVLLTDGQAEVRRSAAEALGEIRSSEAISSLKQALNDPEPRVRAKAGWALSEIEDTGG